MDITYYGHSAFKLKGKNGTVFLDPYADEIGLKLPNVSADIVTTSHDHSDHNAIKKVSGTARRPQPFVVNYPGEYEVGGISVFGVPTYHDDQKGKVRGLNTIFTVFIDEVLVCHLGDLGHELTADQISEIGEIDVLLIPVGGEFTISAKQAIQVIRQLEPYYVIPMHYRTPNHAAMFEKMTTLEGFLKEYGASPAPVAKLSVEKNKMPEETELIVLEPSSK